VGRPGRRRARGATTTTTSPDSAKCKTLAKAGAVRIKWPADAEREESETYTWSILQDANWCQDSHLGWRFTKEELEKRAAAAGHARKRQKA
jgi:hypothetical protein